MPPPPDKIFSLNRGFTLAETLITLGIIGVVAALTIASFISNTQNREYEVARKRIQQTLGEAVRQISIQEEMQNASDAEDFVENYLSQKLKIVKTCSNNNLKACGIETDTNAIKAWSNKSLQRTMPTTTAQLNSSISAGHTIKKATKSYGFVMANGYAVNLFYNPNCWSAKNLTLKEYLFNNYASDYVCVNAIYDMNGLSRPNQAGKDIGFVTVLYPNLDSIAVAPSPYNKNLDNPMPYKDGIAGCATLNKDYTLPKFEEWASITYNRELFDFDYGGTYWITPKGNYSVSSWSGYLGSYNQTNSFNIRCVKR